MSRKIGFFRKSRNSNKELIALFEKIQEIRAASTNNNWKDKDFVKKITELEKKASKRIFQLLKAKKLRTADDFYRAAFILHHGKGLKSYLAATALAAISNHLGEPWGKNLYAVALDRLLLSIGLPQQFGSQYIKRKSKYKLAPFNKSTTDKKRREYLIEPLVKLKEREKELNKEN
jgi:hypothetical protein